MKKDEFIDKYVLGWMKRDFERVIEEIPVIPNEAGNIGFFLALSVLVSMDALGGFLLGEDKRFEENVKEYIGKCFRNPEEYPIEILQDVYRNGLAHDFFSRGAVTRDSSYPAIFRDKEIGVTLDANTLAKDFLESLNKFSEVLTEENYQERSKQLEEKINRCIISNKKVIDTLPERDTPSFSTSTTTVTSTTSSQGGNPQVSAYPPPSMYPPEEEEE